MDHNAIGKLLIHQGFLSSDSELKALIEISKEKKLDSLLIANFLSQKFQMPYLDLDMFDINYVPNDVDIKFIEKYRVLPLKKYNNQLYLAVSDPTIASLVNEIKFQTTTNSVNFVIVEDDKLQSIVSKYLESKGINFGNDLDMSVPDMDIDSPEAPEPDTDIKDSDITVKQNNSNIDVDVELMRTIGVTDSISIDIDLSFSTDLNSSK